MDQQEMSDQLEIQQLCARYMMLSARKDNDHWLDVFTPDGVYHAFGTPYGLEHFPMLLKSAPPGQYIGNPPVVEFHGDTATGVQHYVFIDQTSHEMRLAWYSDEYARTRDGWRIRSRSTTFMRRSGGFDSGNAHDPARFVAGQEIK
jgi:SnoaL-like domain